MDITLANDTPDSLLWTEGMLLTPQHFQQSDIYWEKRMLQVMQSLQPYYWGIVDFSIDVSDFVSGIITVNSIHAVLKDGTVLQDSQQNNRYKLSVDIKDFANNFDSNGKAFVYLGVPRRSHGDASSASETRRYTTVRTTNTDRTNIDSEVDVDRMRLIATLHIDTKPPEEYESIPLFQLATKAKGGYGITRYLPPMLRSSAARFIDQLDDPEHQSLQVQLEQILAEIRRTADYFVKTKVIAMQKLHAITISLPQIEAIVETRSAHPYEIFKSLVHLYGQIASLSKNPLPEKLPIYHHDNPANALSRVIVYLHEAINKIPKRLVLRKFKQENGHDFSIDIPANFNFSAMDLVVEVVPSQGQVAKHVKQWLNRASIFSRHAKEKFGDMRTPGAKVAELTQQERSQYSHDSSKYFYKIKNLAIPVKGGEEVKVIAADDDMLLWGDPNLQAPKEVILYLLKKASSDDHFIR